MDDKTAREEKVIISIGKTLLANDRKPSLFLLQVYRAFANYINTSGLEYSPIILKKLMDLMGERQDENRKALDFDEIADTFYCLTLLDPSKAGSWIVEMTAWLGLDGKEFKRPGFFDDPPYVRVLAGYILAVFRSIEACSNVYGAKKPYAADFNLTFATVVRKIISYGGQHEIEVFDSDANQHFMLIKPKKFQGMLSAVLKSNLERDAGKKVRALYINALENLELKKKKPEELAEILYQELVYSIIGNMEPAEIQQFFFPTK
ncbi:MAG: hypothetical protein NTZ49_00320 [Candidatus Parcubacteria bacterium]|nr:hypothetical protein [Candidatus Parcubacteria bacterium]